MNEENNLMAASELSRISEKHSTFYAFTSQKSESLPHSFFFDGFSSKVIFRVTQNSPTDSFAFLRKPCSARLPTTPPAPDGCLRRGRLKPKPATPDGRSFWAFGWSGASRHSELLSYYSKLFGVAGATRWSVSD